MDALLNFLNSKAGLIILAFCLTTAGGATINYLVQSETEANQRAFEIYKVRYAETRKL